ncbi:hypothetical protein F5B20DRAFT_259502 [Whalleya microplaca]|nr:hypothetical protein F5B20DRAFT_259502 [Whalleya microplaca]
MKRGWIYLCPTSVMWSVWWPLVALLWLDHQILNADPSHCAYLFYYNLKLPPVQESGHPHSELIWLHLQSQGAPDPRLSRSAPIFREVSRRPLLNESIRTARPTSKQPANTSQP